ncbi:DUF2637 domain-containing protein [Streptomyces flaveolus]|uniref:DUF2637 domain-containing protein n=1 Tax=Streptomyces flaveolus TaxID=67297 RepID=UPI0033B43B82
MTDPRPARAGHPEVPPPATPAPVEVDSAVQATAESAPAVAPDAPRAPRRRLTQAMWAVAGVAVVAGLVVAAVGFALSYNTLVEAARNWDFGPRGSRLVPIGIDGLIIALYSIDLVLVWRRIPKPSLLLAAHAVTAVTVVLNILAAVDGMPGGPGVWQAAQADPGRLLMHAAMPVAYVLLTEAARHFITRIARLEGGLGHLTLKHWLLDPRGTWAVWRRAKLWGYPYDVVRELEKKRAIHRVWIKHREEIEAGLKDGAVSVLDRLPDLLAPYGVTVEEALALPDQMRSEEQERRAARERADQERAHKEAADRRAREHADRMATLAAEKEQIRAQAEVDLLKTQTDAERRAAEHRAAGHADVAAIEAAALKSAAERAATEEQRRALAEEQAEETARTAELRRKAAEDNEVAVRLEENQARRADEAARAKMRAAEQAAEAGRIAAEAARAEARAEEERRAAAEARAAAAELDLRASLAEEAARLPDRERQIRRVARMIIAEADGDHLRFPTTKIQDRLGIANSTATNYRDEAARLIASGYAPQADPLHAMETGRASSGV